MAITATAKGTASSNAVTTLNSASITLTKGNTLVVCVATSTGADATSVTWNTIALTNATANIWYLVIAATASAVVTVNLSSAKVAFTMIELSGTALTTPLDKVATATGSSASPSSGATATTTLANEICIASIWHTATTVTSPPPGAWSNSFVAGQNVATTGTGTDVGIEDGSLGVAATGAYTAAKTSEQNTSWGASIATFKGLPTPVWINQYRQRNL